MYAGRVACCTLVCRGEHADGTDGWTDVRLHCTALDAASAINTYTEALSYKCTRLLNVFILNQRHIIIVVSVSK